MKKLTTLVLVSIIVALQFFYSCNVDKEPVAPPSTQSIYEQLGGVKQVADPKGGMIEKGRLSLRNVVDSTLLVVAGDTAMEKFFGVLLEEISASNNDFTGFNALSKNFTEFMCSATGSKTIIYKGISMKMAHNPSQNERTGAKVKTADFDKFIEHIVKGLAKNGITSNNNLKLVEEIKALLETTRKDIVDNTEEPIPTLYEQLGGTALVTDRNDPNVKIEAGYKTLRSVVDSAIFVIAGDPTQTKFFQVLLSEVGASNLTGFNALSKNFTDFLAFATGSKTIKYTGKSMKAAHDFATNNRMGTAGDASSQKASATDFDNFIKDVDVALAKNGVVDAGLTKQIRADLIALLLTTKGDIVQK